MNEKRETQWDSFDEVLLQFAKLIAKTGKAILVEWGGNQYWIPKSQICEDTRMGSHDDRIDVISDVGDVGELAIPKWLYEEEIK